MSQPTNPPPFQIHLLTPSTPNLRTHLIPSIEHLNRLSFSSSRLSRARFPNNSRNSPAVIQSIIDKFTTRVLTDPTYRLVVAVDPSSSPTSSSSPSASSPPPPPPSTDSGGEGGGEIHGTIAAMAVWNILPTQEDVKEWCAEARGEWESEPPPGANREAFMEFRRLLQGRREEVLTGEGRPGVAFLDLMATSPHYQRRGAGKLLVQWGTALARERGLWAFVEASAQGEFLYRACGFEEMEEWRWDVSRFEGAVGEGESGVVRLKFMGWEGK
ncbi:MAG: hypothetical protein Q9227_005620 [Pyrenula ochraceoflavens]